ncbi:MFS transporter [Providencia sp. PROV129]|uniref:MFS transporter n=1 Tax=Providencia sp. PROV129 TaxID=2949839 RepID=UPI0027D31A4E|nr:MFS transporter [Providencia sp. PROV129]
MSHRFIQYKFSSSQNIIYYTSIFMLVLAFSSIPTPFYHMYQTQFLFSTFTLTIIFSVYALSLLITLVVVGAISDNIGRKPIILISLILILLADGLFYLADSVIFLILARSVQGIGTALATSTLCSAIIDVNKPLGSRINSFAPMAGMAVGMLISCTVVTYSRYPLKTTFLIVGLILCVSLVTLIFTTETVNKNKITLQVFKPSLRMPASSRQRFTLISSINISLWMLSGFYLSLMPSLLTAAFGDINIWVSGSAFLFLTIFASITIIFIKKIQYDGLMKVGILLLVVGIVFLLFGVNTNRVALLFVGSALAGIGFGICFMKEMEVLLMGVDGTVKSRVLSVFYIESYLAFCLPVLVISFALNMYETSLTTATNVYGIAILCLLGVSVSKNYSCANAITIQNSQ